MFCNNCGKPLSGDSGFCPACGARVPSAAAPVGAPQVVVVRTEKSPAIAVLLSFLLPGIGQIYNGEVNKGVIFIVALCVSWIATMILIGFLAVPVIYIWSMVDAYQVAERKNKQMGLA